MTLPMTLPMTQSRQYHIITYGCQMNVADSQALAGILNTAGFASTDTEDNADLIIVNTCSVREKAEERALGRINDLAHLKRQNRGLVIAVVGCMAQRLGDRILERAPHVDMVLGTDRMFEIADVLAQKDHTPAIHTAWGYDAIDLAPPVRETPFSAYLTITRGCNNYCTFCIVPYVRGRERHYGADELIRESQKLAEDGVIELTLLGQNVNSYRDGELDFAGLVTRIANETAIARVRYTSPHPKDLSLKLIEAHATLPKLMPHVHLPIQSGSDRVLEKMARTYRYRHYRNMVNKLRERVPQVALTTDVIVGFPTETEDDFQRTLDAFEETQFDSAFMFHYSEREGTRAHRELVDDVPHELKIERLTRLIELQKRISYGKNQLEVGRPQKVLVDGHSRRSQQVLKGKTEGGKTALFPGEDSMIGSITKVKITQADSWTLHGELWHGSMGYRPIGAFRPQADSSLLAPSHELGLGGRM